MSGEWGLTGMGDFQVQFADFPLIPLFSLRTILLLFAWCLPAELFLFSLSI